jgi:4-amino-4-deoxy-L-arabinose transferase-like glycosyltransferase
MILLALGTLLLCGPFFGKAYHIDDTLMVWTAQQISKHPADYFGFDVNWYGFNAPIAHIFLNPPGAAYYAAVFGTLLGWSEPVMRISMALMAVVLVLGVYLLARQLNGDPLAAAIIALGSPGILVSTGTMMTDLPMTALWTWATVLWLRGLDKQQPMLNAVSGLLIGFAALTKYFAIALVPLLLLYTLLSGRRRWARALWLIIPVVMVGLLDFYTQRRYGISHLLESSGILKEFYERYTLVVGQKLLTGLAFLGAGGAPVLFIAPWLWGRVGRIALCAGGAAMAVVTVVLVQSGWHAGESQTTYSWWFWPQYGLWIAAGIHIIVLALAEVWKWRDRDAVLLALWLGGTLYFAMFVNHFVNIRVILPALPVAALLCARCLRMRKEGAKSYNGTQTLPRAVWLGLTAGLILSLCVSYSDMRLANSARTAAERIAPEKRHGRTWFSGHWGFQYYMEARGAKPINSRNPDLRPGDTIVTPMNASNRLRIGGRGAYIDESFDVPVCSWLSTMRAECGAGFYSDFWGPLPFVFGPAPPEQYEVILP